MAHHTADIISLSQGSLQKSSSCDNVARRVRTRSGTSGIGSPERTSMYDTVQKTLLAEINVLLPSLVKNSVQEQLKPMLKKRDELKDEITNLNKKVEGYQKQVEQYVELVKTMDSTTLPNVVKDLAELETAWNNKEKSITTKTRDLLSTQNKIQTSFTEINNLHEEWEKLLKAKSEGADVVRSIEQSQKYVSEEYEDFREKHKKLISTVTSLEQKVAKQEVKSEHNANYPRWDSVEISGIPVRPVDSYGNENCKEMVVNICRELHYWLPPSAISTAHRLKMHESRKGPPAMIVKFNNRDIRNDVFALRRQIKGKHYWHCYNIKKLFINESLTADARKLFYKTRVWAKQMEPEHGRIYTWTFKGEIFIRKNIENGPKRKVLSEDFLSKISKGEISLDIPDTPVKSYIHESCVVIEDILAETTPSTATD